MRTMNLVACGFWKFGIMEEEIRLVANLVRLVNFVKLLHL